MDQSNQGIAQDNLNSAPTSTIEPAKPLNQPAQPVMARKKWSKKSKIILFSSLFATLLVFVGILIFLFWYLSSQNNEIGTKVFSSLVKNTPTEIEGDITLKSKKEYNPESDIKELSFYINQKSIDYLPLSNQIKIKVVDDKNQNFTLSLDTFVEQSGVFYFKVQGIANALQEIRKDQYYLALVFRGNSQFSQALSELENNWWKLTLDDLSNTTGLSNLTPIQPDKAFACVSKIPGQIKKHSDQLIRIYKQNPFLDLTPYTKTNLQPLANSQLYTPSIKPLAFRNFRKSISSIREFNDTKKCFDSFFSSIDPYSDPDIIYENPDNLTKDINSKNFDLAIGVDQSNNNINNVGFLGEEDDYLFSGNFKINYQKPNLSAPEAKPFAEFFQKFKHLLIQQL